MEESIFKFKKAKKMVGDFEPDDPNEWCLLVKPQIGDVTLFVHFHKHWCVIEIPEIEEDEDNGIEYQAAVQKQPVFDVYSGFLKGDSFVVEHSRSRASRVDEMANKDFLRNLQGYLDAGYTKDWNNYTGDVANTPNHYGHQQQDKPGLRQQAFNMNAMRPQVSTIATTPTKKQNPALRLLSSLTNLAQKNP